MVDFVRLESYPIQSVYDAMLYLMRSKSSMSSTVTYQFQPFRAMQDNRQVLHVLL